MEAFTTPESFQNTCPGHASGFPAIILTQLLQNLIAAHCSINNPKDYPRDFGDEFEDKDEFDFVIVGAGSAGSVVANRLSEKEKWKVLVLEAGGDPSFTSDVPALLISTQGSDIDWKYKSEPSGRSCLGTVDKKCSYPRGRVLGGSSTINAMLYVRGNRNDYDEWEKLGNPGWGYEDVLKYFMKSEKLTGYGMKNDSEFDNLERSPAEEKSYASNKFHSNDGYLDVSRYGQDRDAEPFRSMLYNAFEEVGIPYSLDLNGKSQIGIGRVPGTLGNGLRANAAKAFLGPVSNRKNLFVIKNAFAHRLLTEGNKVVGVEFVRNGKVLTARSRKEVILSAGSINSPHLLMLSGIGPKDRLESLGISVIADLPGVGENFQDHVFFCGFSIAFPPLAPRSPVKTLNDFFQFLLTKSGSFSSIGLTDTVGFVDTVSGGEIPDIQYHFFLYQHMNSYIFNEVTRANNWRNDIKQQYLERWDKMNILSVCPTLLRPKSRGRIELTSSDPTDPPRIVANLLEEEEDVETILRGIRRIEKISDSCSFSEGLGEMFNVNVTECNEFRYNSDEYWRCQIRYLALSIYHPVGTCKMGPAEDPMAVVDHLLKVHGMEGIRVADASIMPLIVRGNTNAPSIMIGEKLADLVKNEWEP